MKTILACLAWASLVAGMSAREFTSADGNSSLDAEFVRYDRKSGRVTLRMPDSRNLTTDAKFFCEADRAYFSDQARAASLDSAISVDADDHGKRTSRDTGQMRFQEETISYTFEISNASDYELENLRVNYWVVVSLDNRGNPKNQVYQDCVSIGALAAGADETIKGPKFTLTLGAASTCSCPKVAAAASQIGRDRLLGERVEVRTADGKLLYAESSSIRVDQALETGPKED